jgi:predicted SAM-dependent methyltransferase
MSLRINLGCGQKPTPGWRNFDNSFSVRISRWPLFASILLKTRLVDDHQRKFIEFARSNEIEYRDVTRGLPFADASVDVIYSSHMIEHLDRRDAAGLLGECFRILRDGGEIRLAVPDIRKQVTTYLSDGDADGFVEYAHMAVPRPRSFPEKLRFILFGPRHHQWMYDGKSLCSLLVQHGFAQAEIVPAGQTTLHDHEPLDLSERAGDSVYVEARKPCARET